jgi:hypothetical protein
MATKVPIKHYTRKELSKIYGVCDKTFKRWLAPFLEDIGEKNGRFYSVAQVKIIFKKLELPSEYENNKDI